jgi:hypothetical protein
MRNKAYIFLLSILFLNASPCFADSDDPIRAYVHLGCGVAPPVAVLTRDEERFSSMYKRIIEQLHRDFFANPLTRNSWGPHADDLKKILAEKCDDRQLSCKVVLKPDGQISSLTLIKSSGSDLVDKMALDAIKKSAPFDSVKSSEDIAYSVAFPSLKAKAL